MGKILVSTTQSLTTAKDLANAGKLRSANTMLNALRDDGKNKKDPEFWLTHLHVAMRRNRSDKDIDALYLHARAHVTWTDEMEVIYLVNRALHKMQQLRRRYTSDKRVAVISLLLDDAVRLIGSSTEDVDINLSALVVSARGCLSLALRHYTEAVDQFRLADKEWQGIGKDANSQWVKDNRLRWLTAIQRQLNLKDALWYRWMGGPHFLDLIDERRQLLKMIK